MSDICTDKNSSFVNMYNTSSISTQPIVPQPLDAANRARFGFSAASLFPTVPLTDKSWLKWAILDSGASSHFPVANAPCTNMQVATSPLRIRLPNKVFVTSSHTCDLDLPMIPKAARLAHVVPGMSGYSLISMVKLCNAGCKVTINDISCEVTFRGKKIVSCHTNAQSQAYG